MTNTVGGVKSGFLEHDWEPGLSLWVEVSYLASVYVDVEGWVSMIRKLRTAVRAHIQVAWWWEGACLYLFLTIVCRVFACPSVLAGQIRWRSRHMDQTFCLMKNDCFEVHLILVDLDTTDQPRRAGPILSVNSPDFCLKKNTHTHKVCWEDSRMGNYVKSLQLRVGKWQQRLNTPYPGLYIFHKLTQNSLVFNFKGTRC